MRAEGCGAGWAAAVGVGPLLRAGEARERVGAGLRLWASAALVRARPSALDRVAVRCVPLDCAVVRMRARALRLGCSCGRGAGGRGLCGWAAAGA
jgi:hypothetical protein